ncbi:hypothetical protein ACMYLL_23345, partial [Salmonella enterica subsp. enterica serovar Enteritidis]|uniref:hypothetical protein n=1 Tax=Salmonella enterica TaxID=28901 RepID=UPI0039ED3ABF
PIIPVAAHTGEGIDRLREALQDRAHSLKQEDKPDIFRLPVDRVFTMRGHGTVVTGTLTPEGFRLATRIVYRHKALFEFLRTFL